MNIGNVNRTLESDSNVLFKNVFGSVQECLLNHQILINHIALNCIEMELSHLWEGGGSRAIWERSLPTPPTFSPSCTLDITVTQTRPMHAVQRSGFLVTLESEKYNSIIRFHTDTVVPKECIEEPV